MKDVFLSHTGADKEWVERFADRLEQETVNGRPLQVWFDKWDIDYGENILSKIEDGLKTSRFVAVVLSPAFTRAEWPTMEWQTQVHADPTGRGGRILPILLHKFDPETGDAVEIPLPLRILKWFDFSEERFFEREFARFLARIRGERPPRGSTGARNAAATGAPGQEVPDEVDEALVSNLLSVSRLPPWVYSDLTPARKQAEVWRTLSGVVPPFTLHGGRLYSFFAPDDPANPFTRFLARTDPRKEPTSHWLGDEDKERLLIHLFNDAFREHCFRLRIRTPKKAARARRSDRFQYYFPSFDRQPRVFTWGTPGMPKRQLAKVLPQPDGSELGVHYAAQMRFIALGEDRDLYLMIEPGWMFTSDGVSPLGGSQMGVLSTKWGGKERNATILRHVLMWGLVLAGGGAEIEIDCGGGTSLVLGTVPAHTRMSVGIAGDQIRLDRILGGEGAGEVFAADEELDVVAGLRTAEVISKNDDVDDQLEEMGPDDVLDILGVEEELPF
jgi:hypothetical protein